MIHHISKKLVTLILVGGIALSHVSFALAKVEDKNVSLPTTTIGTLGDLTIGEGTEQGVVVQQLVVGLGYTDEQKAFALETGFDIDKYEAGLIATGARIVDGSVVDITAETIVFMAKSKEKYWGKHIKFGDAEIYTTNIVGDNFSLIPEDIIDSLRNNNAMIASLPFGASWEDGRFDPYYGNFNATVSSYFQELGKSYDGEAYLLSSPFVIDYKTRECEKQMEKYDLYYLSSENLKNVGETYDDNYRDLHSFCFDKESKFPFSIDELPLGAKYTIMTRASLSNSIFTFAAPIKPVIGFDFTSEEYQVEANEAINELVEQYLNSHQR